MTYFPHNPLKRATAPAVGLSATMRPRFPRDVLWNRPVFKAPALPNPRITLDPLPFTVSRLTQVARRA